MRGRRRHRRASRAFSAWRASPEMSSSSPGHGSDGLPVDTASGAAEGVARLRRSGFDLVVWDATLPESSDRARGRSLVPGNRPSVLFLITCGYLHTCLPELGGGGRVDYRRQALPGDRDPGAGPGPVARPAPRSACGHALSRRPGPGRRGRAAPGVSQKTTRPHPRRVPAPTPPADQRGTGAVEGTDQPARPERLARDRVHRLPRPRRRGDRHAPRHRGGRWRAVA